MLNQKFFSKTATSGKPIEFIPEMNRDHPKAIFGSFFSKEVWRAEAVVLANNISPKVGCISEQFLQVRISSRAIDPRQVNFVPRSSPGGVRVEAGLPNAS